MSVSLEGEIEIDAHLVGETGDPGQHISEFMELFGGSALSDCLGKFADLLGEPSDAGRNTPAAITFAVGLLDDRLQLGQIHVENLLGYLGSARCSSSR